MHNGVELQQEHFLQHGFRELHLNTAVGIECRILPRGNTSGHEIRGRDAQQLPAVTDQPRIPRGFGRHGRWSRRDRAESGTLRRVLRAVADPPRHFARIN